MMQQSGSLARGAVVLATAATLASSTFAATPAFVWLEGETAQTTFKVNRSGWGRPHFLSDSNWLHVSVDEDKVEKEVPEEGILLEYPFQSPQAGRYEVWNRIGFEFARSPFEWRLDDRPWQKAAPDDLTTDLMEIAFWCEVAWLKLGEEDLTAGAHRLQIRLPKAKDDKGKWQRMLYASDAICLHEGPFHPNSKFKPGESGREATDEAAAKVVFQLPEAKPSERASVKLGGRLGSGPRRRATARRGRRADQGRCPRPPSGAPSRCPATRTRPARTCSSPIASGIATRIAVPASMAGRAFYLDFPYNNLNTTIYVNGVYCGFEKNPFAPFQMDVTKGIKAGQMNEIWVGIRDAWYGRSADPKRPLKLRKTFNYPISFFNQGFQDLDYPVWNCPQSGILATPSFVAAGGGVYAADVFVKPSVAQKRLEVEAVVNNTTASDVSGEIRWEAVDDTTGQVRAASSSRNPSRSAPGKRRPSQLVEAWTNPKLWWPDTPNLYRLRTTVAVNGKPSDMKETLFGFREWRREGTQFTLNGVVWHMWADLIGEHRSPRGLAGRLPAHPPAHHPPEHRRPGRPRFALARPGTPGRARVLRPQRRRRPPQHHARRRDHRLPTSARATRRRASSRAARS